MFDFSERDKRRLEQLINSKSTDLEWLEFEVKMLRFALSLISDSLSETPEKLPESVSAYVISGTG